MADELTILNVKGLEANTSNRFRWELLAMADRLGMIADWLAAVMSFETAGTFDPAIRNPDSGAVGLIQFTEARAALAGTTQQALAQMSAIEQLRYVERAFAPMKGRVHTLTDTYMVVFAPAFVGRSEDTPLPYSGDSYEWNQAMDANEDGIITVGEAALPVAKIAGAAFGNRLAVTRPAELPELAPKKAGSPLPAIFLLGAFIIGVRRWKLASAKSAKQGNSK